MRTGSTVHVHRFVQGPDRLVVTTIFETGQALALSKDVARGTVDDLLRGLGFTSYECTEQYNEGRKVEQRTVIVSLETPEP